LNRAADRARYYPPLSMKSFRFIPALGAFFVLAAGLAACGGGVPGNSVADMAGNPISTTAFNHWMYVAEKGNAAQSPGAPVIVPTDPPGFKGCIAQVRKQIPSLAKTSDKTLQQECSQLFTSLGNQVMHFLITSYWYQAEAHRLKINVTNAQVQNALQTAKKQQFQTDAAFQTFLKQSGQTTQDILFRVRINEVLKKLLARHQGNVTPAAIQSYYNSHLSQFGSPETRDIRIVRTNSLAAANTAKKALSSGQSWTVVAKKYSVDTQTKNKGGQLTGVTKGQEDAALDKAAFAAKKSTVLGPVHGAFGYYVFEVTKITKSTQQSLAQATPLVRQILQSQTQTSAQTAVDNQAKKQWLKQTTCRKAYAMTDCKGYKPSKASTTSPQTAPQTSPGSASTTTSSSK
jgi:foldase protein PrsA